MNVCGYQEIPHPVIETRNGRCDRGPRASLVSGGIDPRPVFGNLRKPLPEPLRFSLGVQMPSVEELSAKDPGPHSLLVFLQSQPKKALSRLYQRPSSCLCIFRFLLCSRLVKLELTDASGDCCLCYKVTWATRKANCYEHSLAGCFDTRRYHVLLGRARG